MKRPSKRAEANAALDAAAVERATVADPQTGGSVVQDDQPTRTQVKKAQADAPDDAAVEAAENRLRLAVRGF